MWGPRWSWRVCRGMVVIVSIAASGFVSAQSSGGEFELIKFTIDAGGGTAGGGDFELTGAIAQPDANPQTSIGGDFALAGGFWANANDLLFADGFEGG